MTLNKTRGDRGEALAAVYLEKNGFLILERNYRYKRAEIDLIARKDQLLLFVEVKARTHHNFGFPEEAVSEKKADMILMAANQYIYDQKWENEIRFDIISVSLKKEVEICHFEDAFY